MVRPTKLTIQLRNARAVLQQNRTAENIILNAPKITYSESLPKTPDVCRQTIWRREKKFAQAQAVKEAEVQLHKTIVCDWLTGLPSTLSDFEHDTSSSQVTLQLSTSTTLPDSNINIGGIVIAPTPTPTASSSPENMIQEGDRFSYFETKERWPEGARKSPTARKQILEHGNIPLPKLQDLYEN